MHTSQLIQALDSYLKQITINCLYPSVIVQSVNVQSFIVQSCHVHPREVVRQ